MPHCVTVRPPHDTANHDAYDGYDAFCLCRRTGKFERYTSINIRSVICVMVGLIPARGRSPPEWQIQLKSTEREIALLISAHVDAFSICIAIND